MKFLLICFALLLAAYIAGIFVISAVQKAEKGKFILAALAFILMLIPGYFLAQWDKLSLIPYGAGILISFMQMVDPFALTQATADKYGAAAREKAEEAEKKKEDAFQEKRRLEAEERAYQQALEHSQEKKKK